MSILLLVLTVGAENHTIDTEPDIGEITNNGPVIEGSSITFAGNCTGEGTKLVICRENTICNADAKQEDILCTSEFSNELEKSCQYLTSKEDIADHDNDVATCCNEDGVCGSEVLTIPSWMVLEEQATSQITVLDDEGNFVQTTVNQQDITTTLSFTDQPIIKIVFTNLEGSQIGLSKTTRGIIPPEGVEFAKVYSLDLEPVTFTEATLYAPAQGSSLYLCKFWDFELSTCLGSWEAVKNIEPNTEYRFNLQQGSFGLAEAATEIQQIVQPLVEKPMEPFLLSVEGPITNDGPVEQSKEITFTGMCKDKNTTKLILCKDNFICNKETKPEDLLCISSSSMEEKKSCAYITKEEDIGENSDSIATCCDKLWNCAAETMVVSPWIVNIKQEDNISYSLLEWSYLNEGISIEQDGKHFYKDRESSLLQNSEKLFFENNSIQIAINTKIDADSEGTLISKHDYLRGKILNVHINVEGTIGFEIGDADSSITLETIESFNDGKFHLIRAVLDKTIMQIYVDDVIKGEKTLPYVIDINSNAAFTLGADRAYMDYTGELDNELKGVIKDVQIAYK